MMFRLPGASFTASSLRVALWLVLVAAIASTRTDPDLWGHLRFGMDILRDLSPYQLDAYSFTSDREWVNHEWAAELLLGVAYEAAGSVGLVALKIAVVIGMLLTIDRVLAGEGVVEHRHRDLLIAAAVITTIQQAHHLRPQLFSLLFFSLLIWCLLRARHDARWLAGLPVLFGAWSNFHGGWIVGGGTLILWAIGLTLSGRESARTIGALVVAGAVSFVATLANPHGLGLLRFLYETVGFGRADIVDWQPIYVMDVGIWGLWALTAVLACAGSVRNWRTSRQLERLVVVGVLGAGAFQVNRLVGFFAIATVMLVGPALASSLPRRASGIVPQRTGLATAVALLVAAALSVGAARVIVSRARCIAVDAATTPEPGAVEFLKAHGSKGRLLVWFDWGQYALWHLAPDLLVSIDGRRETVYSYQMHDRHLRFFFDAPGGASLPLDLAADYIWIPRDLPPASHLSARGWTPIYEGEKSVIFTRHAFQGAQPAVPPASAAPRCFPES